MQLYILSRMSSRDSLDRTVLCRTLSNVFEKSSAYTMTKSLVSSRDAVD